VGRREGCAAVEDVVAGLDRDAAVAAQSLHEFFDAPSGLALEPSADREGGEHDGEVGFDGVAFVVVDGPVRRSILDMRKLFSICHSWWWAPIMYWQSWPPGS
jgi:hypothetical protein